MGLGYDGMLYSRKPIPDKTSFIPEDLYLDGSDSNREFGLVSIHLDC